MVDVTVASFEEMEPIYDGLARRARASLGVTGWGMQVMTLPPNWDGYPNHRHDASVEDANQEEVYIPIEGSGLLYADGEAFELRPGLMVRVGPEQLRRIVPGEEGLRFVALGAVPGTFDPSPWTELGGPPPVPPAAPEYRMEATASDNAVLVAAQAGDEQAFVRLTAPHRRTLHLHCYRILGSLHDADDALQETMLRAWRGIDRFEPRAPLRSWLYRIATNVCLRTLEQRARDPVAVGAHLEPYPDLLLDGAASPAAGPDETVEERERIGLAFVAAMQLLPPKQRVTVVLRDVLDWSAREVAEFLDDTVPAVNSALQRGRDRLQREREEQSLARAHAPASAAEEERVMRRFQEAWAAADFDGIVALLTDDALLTMPPEAARFEGSAQIGSFFATVPLEGRLDRIRLVPTRANGQPALAAYADEHGDGVFDAYGVMVFALRGDRIDGITGFARQPALFTRLGLPTQPATTANRERST